jgi:hypothetical protein
MPSDISRIQGTPAQVGAPVVGVPDTNPQARVVPFRVATQEQAEFIGAPGTGLQLSTSGTRLVENVLPQTGFLYGVHLDVNMVTAANAAAVAFFEDGPWSIFDTVELRDVNAAIVQLPGMAARLLNLYGAWQISDFNISADANLKVLTTGAVGAGGSFRFPLFVPVSTQRRTLLPLLGNQDRSMAYILRLNLASGGASSAGPVYTTAPTTAGTLTVGITMERYAVPAAQNDSGGQNQVVPSHWGVVPFNLRTLQPEAPAPGQITHYMRRLGNVHRLMLLVLRSNGTRATGETNLPTLLQYRIGNQLRFNETPQYRRALMYQRYASAGAPFDAPTGVICYDEMHDFALRAGYELGNDFIWTQAVSQFLFLLTYPAGIGTTNNSLELITSELSVPQTVAA